MPQARRSPSTGTYLRNCAIYDTTRTSFAIGSSHTSCTENREPSKCRDPVSPSIYGRTFLSGGILTFKFEFYCGGPAKTDPM